MFDLRSAASVQLGNYKLKFGRNHLTINIKECTNEMQQPQYADS